ALLWLSALVFALAVQIKALVLPVALPIAAVFALVEDEREKFANIKAALGWSVGFVLLSAVLLFLSGYSLAFTGQLEGGGAAGPMHMQTFLERVQALLLYTTVHHYGGNLGSLHEVVNWPLFAWSFVALALGVVLQRTKAWLSVALWWAVCVLVLVQHE